MSRRMSIGSLAVLCLTDGYLTLSRLQEIYRCVSWSQRITWDLRWLNRRPTVCPFSDLRRHIVFIAVVLQHVQSREHPLPISAIT